MSNLNFTDIVSFLGKPNRTSGGHHYWQCPYCKDKGRDNLVFTDKNKLLTCFANAGHSRQVLSDMAKARKNNSSTPPVAPKKPHITDDYILDCVLELQEDEKAQEFLKTYRGLYGETLKLGMGIDKKNKRWVFPAYDIQTGELFGAEYRTSYMIMPKELRPAGHKGLFKAESTDSRLCLINRAGGKGFEVLPAGEVRDLEPASFSKNLIITEGFIDAYTLWQILLEENNGQELCTEIATPSNGVSTIKNLLNTISVANYKRIILWLDNDEAGEQARQDIKRLAKFNYSVKKMECSCCKDINEWYLKHNKEA